MLINAAKRSSRLSSLAEEVNAATGHVSLVRPANASWWHDPNLCYSLGCIFSLPFSVLHFANVLNVQIKFKMSSLQRPRQRKLSSSSSREIATTATTSTAARVVLELEMKVKIRRLRRQLRRWRWQRLCSAAERKKLPTLTFKATAAAVVCVVVAAFVCVYVAAWLTTQKTTTKNTGWEGKATYGCANCNLRGKYVMKLKRFWNISQYSLTNLQQ